MAKWKEIPVTTEREEAIDAHALVRALLDAHDAWAAGVPSQPPHTGRAKGSIAALQGDTDA